jgi:rhomboid family GlyGly-CTERM serine protease
VRPTSAAGLPLLVIVVLALELLSDGSLLEYRRPLLAAEPWRLLSGHLVHLSLIHALLNGIALLLLGRLFEAHLRTGELWLILGTAPILISLVLWIAMPELVWYRGLSGVLHALYFAGCVVWLSEANRRGRWLPLAALAAGTLKVLLEQPWDASFPFQEWLGAPVVPQAHLIGALIGVIAGLWFRLRRRHDKDDSRAEPRDCAYK